MRSVVFAGALAAMVVVATGCADRSERVSRMEAIGVVVAQPVPPASRREVRFLPVGQATADGQWLMPVEFDPAEVAMIHGCETADILLGLPRSDRGDGER